MTVPFTKIFNPGEILTASDVNEHLLNGGYQFRETVYFTSSGTFVKADYPWLRAIRVRCQGAGGGAGGAGTTGASQIRIGNRGNGGGYAESFITDIAGLDASVTVTRGAGGAGGVGTSAGGAGGDSSFGALVVGDGGSAGVSSSALTITSLGTTAYFGGIASPTGGTGDFVVRSKTADTQTFTRVDFGLSLKGVDSFWGTGGGTIGTVTGTNGDAGFVFGGGGGGALNMQNQSTNRTGGAGANGIVIVELYG